MKNKTKLLFIVMAGLMLFAAIEVMAQGQQCPSTCTAGPYTLTFNGVSPATCKDANGSFQCYDFGYSLSVLSGTVPFNQATAIVPVACCDGLPVTYYSGCNFSTPPTYPCAVTGKHGDFGYNPGKIYPPGLGDPSGLGAGIYTLSAIRSEPMGTLPNPHIYASSPDVGPITIQIKTKSTYYCQKILGPRCLECPVPPQTPSVVLKNIIMEGMPVQLSIDQNQCVQDAKICKLSSETGDFYECVTIQPITVKATAFDGEIEETVREVSDTDGNQRCAWGRIYVADSPGCTYIPNGAGGFYRVGTTCKCTSSTQCYTGYTCQGGYCKPNP